MYVQLNYVMFQYRSAELRRAGEQTRLATEVTARRRRLRARNPITPVSAQPGRRSSRGAAALEVEPAMGSKR
jgi:hypothetical protein